MQVVCHDKAHALCKFHNATPEVLQQAIEGTLEAKKQWNELPWARRAAIFLKAADLLSGKYRYEVMAATMLGQGKTIWQAEIDAMVETIDFWRFNVKHAEEIYNIQPPENPPTVWNHVSYRPLEGFVFAISPFNFTAIGANLPTSPAIMGNVVVWKPSSTALLSNYLIYKILEEAGVPPGVIQFVPGDGPTVGNAVIPHPQMAGLHFTGSTGTFNKLWKQVASNLDSYRSYPRIVGETGGKNFHMLHSSADIDTVVNQTIRGAFEYQGQKCSATSRLYCPDDRWEELKAGLVAKHAQVKMGDADDAESFMTAVIDQRSFDKLKGYLERAKADSNVEVLCGGGCDDSKGFFVEPTVLVTKDPQSETMRDELFGPVITIYVYEAAKFSEMLKVCDDHSYALTGSIFAQDTYAIDEATKALQNSAGNFYINDKSTGSIVGQQPFGGARGSGTNDKAGSALNLLRWTSCRSIKETMVPLNHFSYPSVAPW